MPVPLLRVQLKKGTCNPFQEPLAMNKSPLTGNTMKSPNKWNGCKQCINILANKKILQTLQISSIRCPLNVLDVKEMQRGRLGGTTHLTVWCPDNFDGGS